MRVGSRDVHAVRMGDAYDSLMVSLRLFFRIYLFFFLTWVNVLQCFTSSSFSGTREYTFTYYLTGILWVTVGKMLFLSIDREL